MNIHFYGLINWLKKVCKMCETTTVTVTETTTEIGTEAEAET